MNDNIIIKIEKPVYEGYGLGFHDGKAVFIPYAVPGDTAEIEIIADKKSHCFGKIIKIAESSPDRVTPECPNFGICGGCDYLNINYDKELSFKKYILKDTLGRIGRIRKDMLPEISVISSGRYHYRSHAEIKCDNGQAGFFERNSHSLVPFPSDGCRLLSRPVIDGISKTDCAGLKQFKIAAAHDGECVISTGAQADIHESENGISYGRDISSFFQANSLLRSKMLDTVRENAELAPADSFLDIGCGVGFFTLYLSQFGGAGTGIDIDRDAIKWARRNARLNSRGNVKFSALSASDIKPGREKYDVIIADPPRPGLSKKSRDAVAGINPGRIVYVSCNPATFARDAADFLAAGYHIKELALIDMFPATYHIETICLFTR